MTLTAAAQGNLLSSNITASACHSLIPTVQNKVKYKIHYIAHPCTHLRVCVCCTWYIMGHVLILCVIQYGWTVVHFAAYKGHLEMLRELLERFNCEADKRDKVHISLYV